MSAEVIPFPPRAQPRPVEIPKLEPVSTQVRELDPRAWGFPTREAMEAAWGLDDGPEAA